MRTLRLYLAVLLLFCFVNPPSAHASLGLIAQGLAKTVYAVFRVPADMMAGSTQAFPLGIVTGAVSGSMKAVAGTVMGGFDMARGAAPYAKYLVFL